jgi:hypothetical protein
VVAHLTRGAEAYIEWITRGLQGDTSPLRSAPEAGTGGSVDHVPHRYDLVSTEDQAWLVPTSTASTHVTCQCNTETLVLLMSGRLSLPMARAEGRFDLEGDRQCLTVFAQWFRDN